jgi:hypothetical protein
MGPPGSACRRDTAMHGRQEENDREAQKFN